MSTKVDFGNWNPGDFWRPWLQLAPSTLVQPVLPGWTFNINSINSSAPQTEINVTAKHSYGRQIGRISDVLCELLREKSAAALKEKPFADFLSMWEEIEQVKCESARLRLEQIASDLAMLEKKNPEEYRRLRDALSKALDDAG